MSLRALLDCIVQTGHSAVPILLVCAAAGIIIGVLSLTGANFTLTLTLTRLAEGNVLLLLLFTAAASIVLGMGMPTVGIYILLATMMGPALEEVGLPAIGAHLFIMYFGMLSMITPPVAVAAFAAGSIAQASMMKTAFEAVRLGWPAYIVPFIFVFEPGLLLRGEPLSIVVEASTAMAGVFFGTAALHGYMMGRVRFVERFACAVLAAMLLVPVGAAGTGGLLKLAGVVAAASYFGMKFISVRRAGQTGIAEGEMAKAD